MSTMHSEVSFELRTPSVAIPLSADVAQHLQTRYALGPALIVVDRPDAKLGAIVRQWGKIGRAVDRERASTLDRARVDELTDESWRVHHLSFVAPPSRRLFSGDVFVVSVDQLDIVPKACATAYVTTQISELDYMHITGALMSRGLLVAYPAAHELVSRVSQ